MYYFKNKNTEEIKAFNIIDGIVRATIKIGDGYVSNPTIDMLNEAGWEEYTMPEPEPYKPTYEELVVNKIRERYSIDDELAILRQRDVKPEEFVEYNSYCEQCKRNAKEEVNANE